MKSDLFCNTCGIALHLCAASAVKQELICEDCRFKRAVKDCQEYTLEEQQRIGRVIGEKLYLRRTTAGLYPTDYGDKSEIGLVELIVDLAEQIKDGTF